MPDRSEYRKLNKKLRVKRSAEQVPNLKLIAQSAVPAKLLTGDPSWDRYIEQIETLIEITKDQRDSFAAMLHDPTVVNTDAMIKAKIGYLECQARIDAWTEAMELPGRIIERGGKATELLEKLGE